MKNCLRKANLLALELVGLFIFPMLCTQKTIVR